MNKTIIPVLLLLLLIPAVDGAIIINPGQSVECPSNGTIVSCGQCHVNETVNTTECEDCSDCEIDEMINPGETFKLNSGTCDIELECVECDSEISEIAQRTYTLFSHVAKPEGEDVFVSLELRDFIDTIMASETYSWDRNSTVSITEKFTFECPTKVVFDNVDQNTCNEFFEEYYTDKDPLSMMLAADTTEYRRLLISCQGNLSATESLMRDYKDLFTDMQTQNHILKNSNIELNNTMTSMDRDYQKEYSDHVPGTWYIAAILEALLIAFTLAVLVYSKSEGGKV